MSIETRHGEGRPPGTGPRLIAAVRDNARRLASFALVGAISTAAFVALYTLGRTLMGPLAANFTALSLTMLFNFLANRKYTFRATYGPIHVQAAQYLAVYVLGLGASSAVLHLGLQVAHEPARPGRNRDRSGGGRCRNGDPLRAALGMGVSHKGWHGGAPARVLD